MGKTKSKHLLSNVSGSTEKNKGKEEWKTYSEAPVLIWDFIRNPDTLKLKFLPVELKVQKKRKKYTESKPTGASGRPIMSILDMYPYFMNKEQWKHCCFLPILSAHYERCSYVTELITSVGLYADEKYIYWATSSSGTSLETNYEPLETYGDSILKFASCLMSYKIFKNDPSAGESDLCERRNWFITNRELFRVGVELNLRRYIRTFDQDISYWVPPFINLGLKIKENRNHYVDQSYTGKHLADWVEALIAAYLLSGGVKHALKFISKIGVVPLEKAGILETIPEDPKMIDIKQLDEYKFKLLSKYSEILEMYVKVNEPGPKIKNLLKRGCSTAEDIPPLGSAYKELSRKLISNFNSPVKISD